MSLRRTAVIVLSAAAALLAGAVLYLAYGDLSRHKGRIEALVTDVLGRAFAIDGPLELQVLPSIAVAAERVRLANADWGSQPQMVEVGRVRVRVGLWSLISGPVDVRSFELSDVAVLLETNADGKGNWVFGKATVPADAAAPPAGSAAAAPPVIRSAKLGNVRVTYREHGKPARVALIETLSIGTGDDGLLAISGKGSLDKSPATVSGELGPLDGLLSGRNIRVALQAALGDLKVEVKGRVGRLDPLGGADLTAKLVHPDIGAKPLAVEARLTDAGALTRLDLSAKHGTTVLEVGGRIGASSTQITLDGLSAKLANATARVDGTLHLAGEPRADLRFELAAGSLRKLQEDLPAIPASLSGGLAGGASKVEVKNLKGQIGETQISGRAAMTVGTRKQVELDLASPRLDLTPFLQANDGGAKPKKKTESKFIFDDTPLPLGELKSVDARLHVALAELKLGTEVLRGVDARLRVEGGRLTLESRARDNLEGTIGGTVKLAPAAGATALDVSVSAKNVRPSLEGLDPRDAPPTNLEVTLRTKGGSARQMASLANGRIVATQGPGKLKSGLLELFGGDLLRELVSTLNPFAAQDPYLQLECTVARADIVDGQVTVSPVLVQAEKLTIVAAGHVDLHTEVLSFSFNTRPRTGVGVSAGMFTNPFIEVAGTLANPRLGMGAKGVTAGAAAAATGGISVLAQGLLDRTRGGQDLCKPTLDEAAGKAKGK